MQSTQLFFSPIPSTSWHPSNSYEPSRIVDNRISLIRDVSLTVAQAEIKKRMENYFRNPKVQKLESQEEEVIALFNGKMEFQEKKPFADLRKLLEIVKIIDIVQADSKDKHPFTSSSYDVRTKILKAGPGFSTNEIYTKTLDPRRFNNRYHLMNHRNWIEERVARQTKIIINQYVKTIGLARDLRLITHNDYVIRGPTGGGKSYFIRKLFNIIIEEKGNISGVLNPDEFKFSIKHLLPYLVNTQVHTEGVVLLEIFKNSIKNMLLNVVIEGRFSSIEQIKEVLEYARKKSHRVHLIDIAVASLSLLLRRVLMRDPYGNDPCPLVQDIDKGYRRSIMSRKKLLEIVREDSTIEFFDLYFVDESDNTKLIARKENSELNIISEELMQKSCYLPSDFEIQSQLDEVIDQNIYPQLAQWDGMKIEKAINVNATINIERPVKIDARLWGEVKVEPFNGLWLLDYRSLKDHVDSEHILHIRRSDSEGAGYHWTEDKFPEGPNLKFSQDTRIEYAPRRGLQMKLGYFLVHPSLIETHLAHPDPKVSDQLMDKKTGWYRFFVHPEAYDNFVGLHFCKDAKFVKPEDSEFMGTPTSSYRSWVVRNIAGPERTIPFILKMGVGSASNRRKFLPKNDILKSIKVQNDINKMKSTSGGREDFFYFPETIGMTLKEDVEGLFQEDSGLIFRQIPEGLLLDDYRIFSFSAIMSIERINEENHGVCGILPKDRGLGGYPLIYEIIEKAIEKGLVRSSFEFINKYLINGYFNATEDFFFKNGYSFSPHGQNLCFVISREGTPLGFAYRDLEGVSEGGQDYSTSYSWFYRYHCIVKLLNVITRSDQEYFDPPPGAPFQLGFAEPLKERNLYPLFKGCSNNESPIEVYDYKNILYNLDNMFINKLSKYFDTANLPHLKNRIPSAEPGSEQERDLAFLDQKLWENRRSPSPDPSNIAVTTPSTQKILKPRPNSSAKDVLRKDIRPPIDKSQKIANSRRETLMEEARKTHYDEKRAPINKSQKIANSRLEALLEEANNFYDEKRPPFDKSPKNVTSRLEVLLEEAGKTSTKTSRNEKEFTYRNQSKQGSRLEALLNEAKSI